MKFGPLVRLATVTDSSALPVCVEDICEEQHGVFRHPKSNETIRTAPPYGVFDRFRSFRNGSSGNITRKFVICIIRNLAYP